MAETAAGGMSLGTLTVQLAADVSNLRKEFNKAFKETQRLADEANSLRASFDRAFGGVAHGATRVAGNLNQMAESIAKVFGENGIPQAREFANSLGLTDGKIKGLETSLKGLSGIFSGVAMAAGLLSAPVVAAIAGIAGLILLVGALKLAWDNNLGGIKEIAKSAWEFVTDSLTTAAEFWIDVFNDVKNSILSAFSAVLKYAAQAADYLSPVIGDGAAGWLKQASAAIAPDKSKSGKEVLADLKAGAPGMIEDIKDVAVDGLMNAFDGVKQSWNAFGGPLLKELMGGLMDAIPEVEKQQKSETKKKRDLGADLLEMEAKARKQYADEVEAQLKRELAARKTFNDSFDRQARRDYTTTANRIGGISVASRAGGPTMTEDALDAATERDRNRIGPKYAAQDFGNAALQGSGVGDMVSAFQKGGGIIGGIINVVLKLFEKSEGFKTILEMVNSVIQQFADGLGQIFDGFQPIVGVIGELVTFVIKLLQPILSKFAKVLEPISAILAVSMTALEGLSPLLEFFAQVIGGVLQAIGWILQKVIFPITKAVNFVVMKIAQAVSWVINGIIDLISAIIWEVGAVLQKFGAQDAGSALKSAANAMHEYEIDTKAINDAANAMWDVTYDDALAAAKDTVTPLGDLGGAAGDAAASMREFSDSLTNLPSGYKIALARYNATTALGGGAGGETNITINVNGGDAGETWKQIKKHMRRDGFLESGSSVATAPAFSAA